MRNTTVIKSLPSSKICYISTTSAKSMLGFTEDHTPTIRELRQAYFDAAKLYHPDVVQQTEDDDDDVEGASTTTNDIDFRDITEAYEHLLNGKHIAHYSQEIMKATISINEEEEYRHACKTILGIPAEIVEESKQNPMFLHWLGGNTDGAQHWRAFFAAYGGLAQKLRPVAGFLEEGEGDGVVRKSETRRKRGGGLRRR